MLSLFEDKDINRFSYLHQCTSNPSRPMHFIKHFEALQRTVKIKVYVNFLSLSGIEIGNVKSLKNLP